MRTSVQTLVLSICLWFCLAGNSAGVISYLDNGVIKVGVDLDMGGSISYLSLSGTTNNIVNIHDLGREIQQSYYAGPQPYNPYTNASPAYPNWPWNPIQSGDVYGNPAMVLAQTNTGQTIYVKCLPMQWALDDVPGQCTFESWIYLDGSTVSVSNRLVNLRTDTAQQFQAMSQELPAIYTIGSLYQLYTYSGLAPFTGDTVTNLPATPPPWIYWRATECWAALLDTNNWGLGVYNPGAMQFVGGFAGTPGTGGPTDNNTGYMAPTQIEVLDTNIDYTWDYRLIVGTLAEIRNWVYAQPYRPTPNWCFCNDRQRWSYILTTDAGWPVTNGIQESLNSNDPQTWGPACAFQATNVPQLYIRAAFQIAQPAGRAFGQLFWETNNTGGFSQANSYIFPLIVDGQYHTYALNLGASNGYTGLITKLRFDPAYNGQPGDLVTVAWIASSPNGTGNPDQALLNVTSTNGLVAIQFPTVAAFCAGDEGKTLYYDLLTCTNLNGGVWQGVPSWTNIVGDNQARAFTTGFLPMPAFYRLRVRLE